MAVIFAILEWVLPLLKVASSAFTKSQLPQEIIDAANSAILAIEKILTVQEPTRAQIMALDIDPNAWGPAPAPK
jgi:hypothetical protein